ncbi:conserved hypothetical protein [Thermotomaculum hydrothermale]|uniref:Nitrogen regulatory protein P-II n=1 Tax=Thermotomaculum hydrothermale TaxID=981385 RepID=A0A7R6SZD2_9BACT|nr:hypothetical protein [Thermotomaculum hydrothermale]BBB33610.1 conserved hypothetical protein [Thermotomaculum hydrothermale]
MSDAKLLVCIIEKEEKLEEVLEGLVEIGITGASILDVRGMFEFLADEIPIFAGFRNLIEDKNPTNKMIISVIKDDNLLKEAMDTIEEIYGSFSNPNTGIMFSLNIGNLRGLKL